MTPLEVMDGRITKLKKEITTEKNATTKSQKEALLQQMEGVKGEIEGKTKGNVEGNNHIEGSIDYDSHKQEIQNIVHEYDTQTLETHLIDIESKLKNTSYNRFISRVGISEFVKFPDHFGINDKTKKLLENLQQSENKIYKIFDKEFDRIYNMYKNDDKES